MPWNGSGTFSLTEPPINFQASPISSADMNSKHADIVAGLNNTLPRDGQAAMTGSLPMGANKITGLGAATLLTDAARADQVQNGAFVWCGSAGGTANAITLSPSPAITSYVAGQTFRFVASANNTDATTVNISSLGAKAVKASNGALDANVIISGFHYEVTYDGTDFILNQRTKVADGDVANLLDWNGADPTGSNDNDSIFRAALAQSLAVFVPTGRWVLDGATAYALKDFHCIFGEGGPTAAAGNTSATGGSRLLLTGSASSAFVNDDVSTKLLHTSIRNLEMYATGTYSKVFDLTAPVGCDFSNFDIETNQATTTLFYSRKLVGVGEFSWVNKIVNCRWRIPDAATVYNIDTDMSDSPIMACEIGGGLGMILRGTGGVRVVGNIINNTLGGASAAGITVSIESASGAQHEIVGNQIEVNGTGGTGYDILIDGDQGASPSIIGTIITGNMFRSPNVAAPIHLKRTSGAQYNGGIVIDDNVFNVPSGTQTAVTFDRTYWTNVRVGTNNSTFSKDYGFLRAGRSNTQSEVTIASGAIDVHSSRHIVDTEASASTDDLDTINGLQDGEIVILSSASDARNVVVKDGTGNISLPNGDFTLDRTDALIALLGTATGAVEMFRQHGQVNDFWLPSVTFAVMGDAVISYTERTGWFSVSNNVCTWQVSLQFSTNAYTTASGVFSISGPGVLPKTAGTAAFVGRLQGLDWQAGDKQMVAFVAGTGEINVRYEVDAGSGGNTSTLHWPASASFVVRLAGSFIIA